MVMSARHMYEVQDKISVSGSMTRGNVSDATTGTAPFAVPLMNDFYHLRRSPVVGGGAGC